MSNLRKLFEELKTLKEENKSPKNTKEIWSLLGQKKWEEAGFNSEEEAASWASENSYHNL
jgi:ribosomal 50S subunit-associated protein YjgA (DUF615 family)